MTVYQNSQALLSDLQLRKNYSTKFTQYRDIFYTIQFPAVPFAVSVLAEVIEGHFSFFIFRSSFFIFHSSFFIFRSSFFIFHSSFNMGASSQTCSFFLTRLLPPNLLKLFFLLDHKSEVFLTSSTYLPIYKQL